MPVVIAPPPEPPRDPEPASVVNRLVKTERAVGDAEDLILHVVRVHWAIVADDRGSGELRIDGSEASLPEIDHARWARTVQNARVAEDVEVPLISPFGGHA